MQYTCNPGIAASFPWLSRNAAQYEKYIFTELVYYYKHKVSEFNTAGSQGEVYLAFDYDASDPPFTSTAQIADVDPHNNGMPSNDFAVAVDCREAFDDGPKYVRTGNLPGGASIHDYDCGIINVAVDGAANDTTKLGELHVHYKGFWIKPTLDSTASAAINYRASWFQSTAGEASTTATERTIAVATASTNGLNIVNTSGSMVPPAGNYIVKWSAGGNDTSNEAFSVSAYLAKGGTNVNTAALNIGNISNNSISTASTLDVTCSSEAYVTANGTDAFTLRCTLVGAAGTLTQWGSVLWLAV